MGQGLVSYTASPSGAFVGFVELSKARHAYDRTSPTLISSILCCASQVPQTLQTRRFSLAYYQKLFVRNASSHRLLLLSTIVDHERPYYATIVTGYPMTVVRTIVNPMFFNCHIQLKIKVS